MSCKNVNGMSTVTGVLTNIVKEAINKSNSDNVMKAKNTATSIAKNIDAGGSYKKSQLVLPTILFVPIPKASAMGKRRILVDIDIFGPSIKDRKSNFGVSTNDTSMSDLLRFASGQYWAIDDGGTAFVYINDMENSPFEIIDYDLTKSDVIAINDIENTQGIRGSIEGLLESVTFFNSNFGGPQKALTTFFGTQQWVLVRGKTLSFINTSAIKKTVTELSNYSGVKDTSVKSTSNLYQFSENKWKAFFLGGIAEGVNHKSIIDKNRKFYDHTFEIPTPFSSKEISGFEGINRPLIANIKAEYNFYMKEYEEGLVNIPESIIPNLYVLFSELKKDIDNKTLEKVVSLGGILNTTGMILTLPKEAIIDPKTLVGDYFTNFVKNYNALILQSIRKKSTIVNQKRQEVIDLEKKMMNIVFPMNGISLIKKYQDKEEMFPMYVNIDFATDRTTIFSDILDKSKMSVNLIKTIMNDVSIGRGFENKSFIEATEIITQQINESGGSSLQRQYSFASTKRRTWEINSWLKDLEKEEMKKTSLGDLEPMDPREKPLQIEGRESIRETIRNNIQKPTSTNESKILASPTNLDIGIFLENDTEQQTEDPSYIFFKNLLKIIFVGKIRNMVKDKFRTYEDMMKGKLAYSETVLYRVEKMIADKNGLPVGPAIQNFYFVNSNEIDVLSYIDTQVKYNTRYIYNVYAYQAVIGTEYNYTYPEAYSGLGWFLVTQTPSIILVEVPYYTYTCSVIDDPPVMPDVELIPYKGVNNQLLMFLNGGVGDYEQQPIYIESTDKAKYDELRLAKNLDFNEKVRFKTDDFTSIFQVFRTDVHPGSYSDFASKLIATVETDVSKVTPQKAPAAGFIDEIKPNKKYWYVFRSIDNHDHVGYPSELFQVEMVDNHGTVYPIIQVVDFKKSIEKKSIKEMRKYVQIKPRLTQTLVNEEKSGIDNVESVREVKDVILGLNDETAFGKYYLIRLTSKNTGKIIEFKVKFEHNFIRKE